MEYEANFLAQFETTSTVHVVTVVALLSKVNLKSIGISRRAASNPNKLPKTGSDPFTNMPADGQVLCTHCGMYMSRRREREHRKLVTQPYIPPPLVLPSRIRRVADSDSDDEHPVMSNGGELGAKNGSSTSIDGDAHIDYPLADDSGNVQLDYEHISPALEQNVLRNRWGCSTDIRDDVSDSDVDDSEQPPYPMLEDEEELETGSIDWAAIEANSGLSAWDQLGEDYE